MIVSIPRCSERGEIGGPLVEVVDSFDNTVESAVLEKIWMRLGGSVVFASCLPVFVSYACRWALL